MRVAGGIFAGMTTMPAMALAVCDGGNTMRDWGLHRSWKIERDCRHPERPATLVEVPWAAGQTAGSLVRPPEGSGPGPGPLPPPEVRSGMQVVLRRGGEKAEVHLTGRALQTGRRGERVAVKAGLGGARLTGVVCGPGMVELPQKAAQ